MYTSVFSVLQITVCIVLQKVWADIVLIVVQILAEFCSLSEGFDNCVILLILVFIQS